MLAPVLALILALALTDGMEAGATEHPSPLPLFDTHLHYSSEDAAHWPPAAIVQILDRNAVERCVVTGTPATYTAVLYRHAPQRIVPFLGVYRSPADKTRWHQDATLPGWVESQLDAGVWRGVGELHIFAAHRNAPVFLAIVRLATARSLPLLLHADPAVIDTLFEHTPEATVIWAHAGAYPYPPLLRDYLDRYPRLYLDVSVRDERIAPQGELLGEWDDLFVEYPQRFMVGVDTYSVARWKRFDAVTARIRGWLDQLPPDVAAQLAHGNARRLFGDTP